MTMTLIKPITTAKGLEPLIRAIHTAEEVCVDSEADSMHHYFEKLCLLQLTVSHDGSVSHFLVDTLADVDLTLLFEALKSKPLVLHGADYDLRMLRSAYGFAPCAIFDTMLAARFAGHTALGLDALVRRYIGKEMDHGMQKADWSQRPLPARLLQYAVEDTAHLPLIAQKLREELTALGRIEWHRQQCQQLIEICAEPPTKDDANVWRIKGSFYLDRGTLAVLRELWLWRDQRAREWDRPPFMVLGNDKLIELSVWARNNPRGDLLRGPELPKRWPARYFRTLRETLKKARAIPESEWPQQALRGERPAYDPHFLPRLKRLRAERDAIAHQLKLAPAILATTAMVEQIASTNPRTLEDFSKIERWLPWQTELLGERFLRALKV